MPWAPIYEFPAGDVASFVKADADDPWVGAYVTAASRAVDDYCNRQFGRLDVAAEFTYPAAYAAQLDTGRWLVLTDDIPDAADTVVTVDGVAAAAGVDGYQMWPPNAVAKGSPYLGITLATRPYGDVGVTNRFGWLSSPTTVFAAVRLQVNVWFTRRENPLAASIEGAPMRSARLDLDVRSVLNGGHLVRSRMPR